MKDNYKFFNVLKGIAIVLVVIGHATSGLAHNYAYSHHLALFFFISGFLYNEEKYGNDPFLNIGNRIKNNWPKYVLYTSLIGLLNFSVVYTNIFYQGQEPWDFYKYRNYVLNNMVMVNTERLCGSMWFVAPLIVSSALLGIIVYFGRMAQKIFGHSIIKHIVISALTVVAFLLGNERMMIKFRLNFRLDVALYVLPIMVIAYYISTYKKDFRRYLKMWVAIPLFVIVIYMSYKNMFMISLVGQNVEIKSFYFLAIVGIYQSMCFANVISNWKNVISKLFEFLGRYTFEIMTFHFLVFKVVDIVWYKLTGDQNFDILSKIPHSYELELIYIILGCMVPAFGKYIFDRLMKKLKNNMLLEKSSSI